ncbi:MAG: hypothetical protein GF417_09980, partial [Candidatus Latescibacteria bacterium]|nr:hypothetical protein [Candidatus Latescibacterota bacterium]
MKVIKICLVSIMLLVPSLLLAVETETVGEAGYTWIETTWDKSDIYTQAGLL